MPPRPLSALVAALLAAVPAVCATAADFKVFMPTVEKGETEIEFRGRVSHDRDPALDREATYKFDLGYGVTDWWFTEIEGEWKREPGESTKHEATATENVFQLVPQGKYALNLGFFAEIEKAAQRDDANAFQFGPIVQKEWGPTLHTVNLFFEQPFGSHAQGGPVFQYGWQSRWPLTRAFQPGFEAFGEIGEAGHPLPLAQQEHRIGPALFGKMRLDPVPGELGYELGYLFGLTSATPSGAVKFLIEYEIYF